MTPAKPRICPNCKARNSDANPRGYIRIVNGKQMKEHYRCYRCGRKLK